MSRAMDMELYCRGYECPVRNGCLRYTTGLEPSADRRKYIRKCTSQRKYIQNEEVIHK